MSAVFGNIYNVQLDQHLCFIAVLESSAGQAGVLCDGGLEAGGGVQHPFRGGL